jgi:hypothetical protein
MSFCASLPSWRKPASDRVTRSAAQQGVNQPIEIPPGQSFIPL